VQLGPRNRLPGSRSGAPASGWPAPVSAPVRSRGALIRQRAGRLRLLILGWLARPLLAPGQPPLELPPGNWRVIPAHRPPLLAWMIRT
jgi:hypothetical protein